MKKVVRGGQGVAALVPFVEILCNGFSGLLGNRPGALFASAEEI